MRSCCLREIAFFGAEMTDVDRLIARDTLSSPQIRRLMTVPGVGVIVGATLMAATGDIGLVGYLGMDPRVR
jgi:transposase